MALRLADVIEEYLDQEHAADGYPLSRQREFSEGLEKHLRDNFLILAKDLKGTR